MEPLVRRQLPLWRVLVKYRAGFQPAKRIGEPVPRAHRPPAKTRSDGQPVTHRLGGHDIFRPQPPRRQEIPQTDGHRRQVCGFVIQTVTQIETALEFAAQYAGRRVVIKVNERIAQTGRQPVGHLKRQGDAPQPFGIAKGGSQRAFGVALGGRHVEKAGRAVQRIGHARVLRICAAGCDHYGYRRVAKGAAHHETPTCLGSGLARQGLFWNPESQNVRRHSRKENVARYACKPNFNQHHVW